MYVIINREREIMSTYKIPKVSTSYYLFPLEQRRLTDLAQSVQTGSKNLGKTSGGS